MLDIDGIRKLARLLEPLQKVADAAEMLNSIEAAQADALTKRDKALAEEADIQARIESRQAEGRAWLEAIKTQAEEHRASATAAMEATRVEKVAEVEKLVEEAKAQAQKMIQEARERVNYLQARAADLAVVVDDLDSKKAAGEATLKDIKAAIAKITGA